MVCVFPSTSPVCCHLSIGCQRREAVMGSLRFEASPGRKIHETLTGPNTPSGAFAVRIEGFKMKNYTRLSEGLQRSDTGAVTSPRPNTGEGKLWPPLRYVRPGTLRSTFPSEWHLRPPNSTTPAAAGAF
ncbi:uncharacterized protein RHO17_003098 [Thomomys bottae]